MNKYDLLPESIHDIISSVATVVTRRFKSYVERDDIIQECYAWALPRASYIHEQFLEENKEKLIQNEKRIGWQMKRAAERYARKEKATKSGYQINDEAYYETYTISQLLQFVLKAIETGQPFEQGQQMVDDGMPKRTSAPAESGNLIVMLIDIKKAYLLLGEEEKNLLRQRYLYEFTLKQMSEPYKVSISTIDRWCENALRKLQDNLGGVSPFN